MKKLVDAISYIQLRVGALFLFVFLITVMVQVVNRYLIGYSLLWTEPIAKYSFIFSVLMGASVMVLHQKHFSFNELNKRLSGKVAMILNSFIHGLIALFGLVLLYYGLKLTQTFMSWTITGLPSVSQGYVWVSMPITGITIALYSLYNLKAALEKGGGES